MIAGAVSLLVILAGAVLLGWRDLYHLAAGLPALVAGSWLGGALLRRMREEGEEGAFDPAAAAEPAEPPRRGPQLVRAGFLGVAALGLLAAVFALLARTPVHALFYGRDCPELVAELATLAEAGAHERVLERTGERLEQVCPEPCRRRLGEIRVRSRLVRAETLAGPERAAWLEPALAEARELGDRDLEGRIRLELEAGRLAAEVASKAGALAAVRDEAERMRAELARFEGLAIPVAETARGWVVTLEDTNFALGSSELTGSARARLAEVAVVLERLAPGHRLRVEGHADASGGDELNRRLSLARAEGVAERLRTSGLEGFDIEVAGLGASRPLASNETPEGRARNRRVEIVAVR